MLRAAALLLASLVPILVRLLILSTAREEDGFSSAVWICMCLLLFTATVALLENHWANLVSSLRGSLSSALLFCIQDKAMRQGESAQNTVDKTSEAVTFDIHRCADYFVQKCDLILMPIHGFFIFSTVVYIVGWPAFVGLLSCSLLLGTGALLSRWAVKRSATHRRFCEEKAGILQEIMTGILSIKANNWQEAVLGDANAVRSDEIKEASRLSVLTSLVSVFLFLAPVGATAVSVSLRADNMTAAAIFPTLLLFQTLVSSLVSLFTALGSREQSHLSCQRLESFFLSLEVDGVTLESTQVDEESAEEALPGSLFVQHADFSFPESPWWNMGDGSNIVLASETGLLSYSMADEFLSSECRRSSAKASFHGLFGDTLSLAVGSYHQALLGIPDVEQGHSVSKALSDMDDPTGAHVILRNITLEVGSGELIAVVGERQCGKTALLRALLGEGHCLSCSVQPPVLYCPEGVGFSPQYPFLLTGVSIQENIQLGRSVSEEWYHDVLRAVGLVSFLEELPHGDGTIVTEQSKSHFSHQEIHRISVARAIVTSPDLVLLDEPFSAFATASAREFFDLCVRDFLAGKTRMVSTNRLDLLPFFDRIICLDRGRIAESGTYAELMEVEGGLLYQLVQGELPQLRSEVDPEEEALLLLHNPPSHARLFSEKNPEEISAKPVSSSWVAQKVATTNLQESSCFAGLLPRLGMSKICVTLLGVLLAVLYLTLLISIQWLVVDGTQKEDESLSPGHPLWLLFGSFILIPVTTAIVGLLVHRVLRTVHDAALKGILFSELSYLDTHSEQEIFDHMIRQQALLDTRLVETFTELIHALSRVLPFGFLLVNIPAALWFSVVAAVSMFTVFRWFPSAMEKLAVIGDKNRALAMAVLHDMAPKLTTIRALGLQNQWTQRAVNSLMLLHHCGQLLNSTQRWFSLRLDLLASVLIGGTAVLLSSQEGDSAGISTVAGLILFLVVEFSKSIREIASLTMRLRCEMRMMHPLDVLSRLPAEGANNSGLMDGQASKASIQKFKRPTRTPGRLDFGEVWIKYNAWSRAAIRNLTFSVDGGNKLWIVGPSGAGKTSIIMGLLRLATISAGRVFMDDCEIDKLDIRMLRSTCCYVPTTPFLFSKSIRKNLSPGKEVPEQQLWGILAKLGVKEYIQSLPGQLDFLVESGGLNLPLHICQLLSIGRALVSRARVFFFDDVTSLLGGEDISRVLHVIQEDLKDRTVLISTTNTAQIPLDQNVMLLSKGTCQKICASGELLSTPALI